MSEIDTIVIPAVTMKETGETIGKTFSEDYVKTVREEAKENRLARKAAETEAATIKAKLKAVIGLKDDEEYSDAKLTAYQLAQEKRVADAMFKANERLIIAEIRNQEGYDHKLVERLIDKSKITINDDGTVAGLKEALAILELEFPQIRKGATASGANPPGAGVIPEIEQLETLYAAASKTGDTVGAVVLKNKIFALQNKK